jgi:hypothetical protein
LLGRAAEVYTPPIFNCVERVTMLKKILVTIGLMAGTFSLVSFGPSPLSAPFSATANADAGTIQPLCPEGTSAWVYCDDNGKCFIFCA